MKEYLDRIRHHFEHLAEAASGPHACAAAVMDLFEVSSHRSLAADSTMLDLYNVLSEAGLTVRGCEGSIQALSMLAVPAILHLNDGGEDGHFVVCLGHDSRRFVVADPRRGIRRYSAPDLARRWASRAALVVDGVCEASEARFRCIGADIAPFGHQRVLAQPRGAATARILTISEAKLLGSTDRFRTLAGHEAWAHAATGDGAASRPLLQDWVSAALLVSEASVRDALPRLRRDGAGVVASIGFPSHRRAAALERAVRAFTTNAASNGRRMRCIVASTDGIESQLDELSAESGLEIVHLDAAWRREWIHRLATESDVPHGISEFALFGDPRCSTNYGANRNTLLLATAGELTIQIDDDTLLPGMSVPVSGGLALTSRFDPNEYWFEEPSWSAETADIDYVGLHETMLGKHPASILADFDRDEIDIAETDAALLDILQRDEARVGVTFVGHDGDVGTASNAWRLFLDGNSLARLTLPGYTDRIRRRESGRTVRKRTLGSGQFCAAMNMGLDNRDGLPPFMPVGRNEDGVFSAALGAARPDVLRGFCEGYVIRHRPIPGRDAFPSPIRFEGLKANDIMILLIDAHGTRVRLDPTTGLRSTGHYLRDVGLLEQADFDAWMRHFVRCHIGAAAAEVEKTLADRAVLSAEHRSDVSAYLESMEVFAASRECAIPTDLNGSPADRSALFRHLIRSYGDLLTHWPDIMACAAYVRPNAHFTHSTPIGQAAGTNQVIR